MSITVELPRPPQLGADDFSRADLEFRGVDHSAASFEARVYLNNPEANADSGREPDSGYAGSFYVFGHGGCFGEVGHCDVPSERRGPYDRRLPHQLLPQFRTVIITQALRRLVAAGHADIIKVTVVSVARDNPVSKVTDTADPLRFESVSLFTYADPSAAGIPLPS
jgi:tyrosinase